MTPRLLQLVGPKWRQVRNAPRSNERAHGLALVLFILFGVAFWLTLFGASRWFFLQCLQVQLVGQILVRRLLDMLFLTFLSVLLFSNVITAFTTFLLADDLTLLVASPIPSDRLYKARLGETALQSSWMVLIFGLPILAAAGVAFGAGPAYYLLTAAVLVPFLVIPAVVGSAVTLSLATLFSAQKSQRLLMFLAVLAFAVLYLLFRLLQPERLLDPEGFDSLVDFVAAFQTPGSVWLPSHWATETLFPVLRGDDSKAALFLTLLYTTAGASVVIGTWLARPMHHRAYSRALEGQNEEGTSSRIGRVLMAPLTWLTEDRPDRPPSAVRQLMLKDGRIFFRDTAQWSQLILLGALVVVYVLNFKNFKLMEATGAIGPVGLYLINQGLSGFVIAALSVRFVFPAVSLEGRAFWILRTAPVRMEDFLRAKCLSAFIPLAVLSCLLAALTNWVLESPLPLALTSIATTAILAAALTGLGAGLGAMYPRFHIDNPARIASGFGGVVYMISAMFLVFIVLTLSYLPVRTLYFVTVLGRLPNNPRHALVATLTAAALLLCLLAAWIPVRAGARALVRYDN